jgi:hypothetical protein
VATEVGDGAPHTVVTSEASDVDMVGIHQYIGYGVLEGTIGITLA